MPAQEDIWSRIDHELVGAMLGQGQLHLHAETLKHLRRIQEERLRQGYAGPTLREVLAVVGEYLGREADLVCDVYENVWKDRGNELTPDFIRTVYRKAIAPTIDARTGPSVSLAEQAIIQMRIRSTSDQTPADFMGEAAQQLKEFWRRKSEIDAKRLEYAAESNPPLLKSRRGRKKGQRFPETLALEKAFQTVIDTLARSGDFKPKTKTIVAELSKHRPAPPLPKGWSDNYRIKTWQEVLKSPEMLARAAKLFVKIKKRRQSSP